MTPLREFFDELARDSWERRARDWQELPIEAPACASSLFGTVVECCELAGPGTGVELRFYIEHAAVDVAGAYAWLPKAADGDFDGYHRRVKQELGTRRYALVVNNPEALDYPLWAWSRRFLSGLYGALGMNGLGVYYALFIGDYTRTPFGVHFDAESVFHFPIIGEKRIRAWSHDFVLSNPALRNALAYEPFVGGSQLLEARPGGAIYWPSSAWHIGESKGTLSVSLALSLKCSPDLVQELARWLFTAPGRHGGAAGQLPFDPRRLQDSAERTPRELIEAVESLRTLLAAADARRIWLQMVTGFGFLHPPRGRRPERVRPTEVVRGTSDYPVVVLPAESGRMLVSACGHVLEFDDRPELRALVARVNEGSPVLVRTLLNQACSAHVPIKEAWRMLDELYRIRALERIDAAMQP